MVGYPGDLSDRSTGEKGAFMYEMFLRTEFELATQKDTMLEYYMDTFGGKSTLENSSFSNIEFKGTLDHLF